MGVSILSSGEFGSQTAADALETPPKNTHSQSPTVGTSSPCALAASKLAGESFGFFATGKFGGNLAGFFRHTKDIFKNLEKILEQLP